MEISFGISRGTWLPRSCEDTKGITPWEQKVVSDSLPVLQSLGSQLQSGTGEAAQGAGESADSMGIEYIQCDFLSL